MKKVYDFENGCTALETLDIYSKFINNPHVDTCVMHVDEGEYERVVEKVILGFMHYSEMMMVSINCTSGVGEVFVEDVGNYVADAPLEGEEVSMVCCGLITVDSLVQMFRKLPHIQYYLEGDAEGETIH